MDLHTAQTILELIAKVNELEQRILLLENKKPTTRASN